MEACPSISETILGFTFGERSKAAHVCLRSWKRTAGKPIALAFTPDARMLVATQPGQLRLYKNGTLLQTPALNLSGRICSNSGRGLLGVAVDPNFSANHENLRDRYVC
jgi:glucose/arabinose dehydrogenase